LEDCYLAKCPNRKGGVERMRTITTNPFSIFTTAFMLAIMVLCAGGTASATRAAGPIIHVDETTVTFPTVFQGEKLSHTFAVFNRGTADLDIKKVTPS
jgi:hypothetical protein